MSCKGLELMEGCLDVSSSPFIVEITSEDTDFVNDANAELYIGRSMYKKYTVGDGITITDYNGNPRRMEISIEDIPTSYANGGNVMVLSIRPSSDLTDLLTKRIVITDNHAKR